MLIHYELPDDLHRAAKSAAALEGVTLKEFLIQALQQATTPRGTYALDRENVPPQMR